MAQRRDRLYQLGCAGLLAVGDVVAVILENTVLKLMLYKYIQIGTEILVRIKEIPPTRPTMDRTKSTGHAKITSPARVEAKLCQETRSGTLSLSFSSGQSRSNAA